MGFSRQEYWSVLPFPSPVFNLCLQQNDSVIHIYFFIFFSIMIFFLQDAEYSSLWYAVKSDSHSVMSDSMQPHGL